MQSFQFGKKQYYQSTPAIEDVLGNKKFRKFTDRLFNHPDTHESEVNEDQDNTEQSIELDEISEILENLSNAVEEKKVLESELSRAVLSIRDQYQRLSESQKYEFIANNPMMMRDLLDIEEKLIDTGLISYEDVIPVDKDNQVTSTARMNTASRILRNIVVERFPDILSPAYDKLEQAYKQIPKKVQEKHEFPYGHVLANTVDYGLVGAALSNLAESIRKSDIFHPEAPLAHPAWKNILPQLEMPNIHQGKSNLPSFLFPLR